MAVAASFGTWDRRAYGGGSRSTNRDTRLGRWGNELLNGWGWMGYVMVCIYCQKMSNILKCSSTLTDFRSEIVFWCPSPSYSDIRKHPAWHHSTCCRSSLIRRCHEKGPMGLDLGSEPRLLKDLRSFFGGPNHIEYIFFVNLFVDLFLGVPGCC